MSTEPLPRPAGHEFGRRTLAVILLTVGAYGVTMGMVPPLIAVVLDGQGYSRTLIGFHAAMPAFGQFVASALIIVLAQRFGIRQLLVGCLALDALLLAAFCLTDGIVAWFIIRLFMGASVNSLLILSETWINATAPDHARGRILGMYNGVLALAMAVGPLLLGVVGTAGTLPFLVAGAFIVAAGLPTAILRTEAPPLDGHAVASPFYFIRAAPILAFATLMFAWRELGGMSMLPLYSMYGGMGEAASMYALTVAGIGGISLQFPIGWLADRCGSQRVMTGCTAVALVTSFALSFATVSWPLYAAVLFVWGGAYAGIYTLVLMTVGERYRGSQLVVVNAGIGVVWGIGHLTGPSLLGAAMDIWTPHGLPLVFCLGLGCLLAVLLRAARESTVVPLTVETENPRS